MNYKLLLRKYIEYIIEVEGSNFITYYSHKDILARSKFTKEEWKEKSQQTLLLFFHLVLHKYHKT